MFRIVSLNASGAILAWDFAPELFAPSAELRQGMIAEGTYIFRIYRDGATQRFLASAKIDKFLGKTPVTVKPGELAELLVESRTDLGHKAIVNHAWWGLLYKTEVFQDLRYGQKMTGYVKKVREDGKIDLSLQKDRYQVVPSLSGSILAHLKAKGGDAPLTDKTPPEEIHRLFGVSKKKFKMAIGRLYKERKIILGKEGIKIIK